MSSSSEILLIRGLLPPGRAFLCAMVFHRRNCLTDSRTSIRSDLDLDPIQRSQGPSHALEESDQIRSSNESDQISIGWSDSIDDLIHQIWKSGFFSEKSKNPGDLDFFPKNPKSGFFFRKIQKIENPQDSGPTRFPQQQKQGKTVRIFEKFRSAFPG